jgi:hypothetical protein
VSNFVLELHSASPNGIDQARRSLYSHSNGAAVDPSWQIEGVAYSSGEIEEGDEGEARAWRTLLEEIEEGDEGEAILSRRGIAALI